MIGNCFYYQTPPKGDHLFVVLAPSLEQKGWFVCVNITTKRQGADSSCELFQGEHQELTSPVSVVVYGQAREFPAPFILRLMQDQRLPQVSSDLLSRIQQAALGEVSRMKKKFQNAIREHLRSEPQKP